MKTKDIHPLKIEMNIENCRNIQKGLFEMVSLENANGMDQISTCAGVDLAYWNDAGVERGVCCIVVMDYKTGNIMEETSSTGEIHFPYLPGFLAFRELPLVIKTAKQLRNTPDLFLFDGNGYLHPRHMGIATHASLFLDKPTIGIAKNYLHIDGIHVKSPENIVGAYEEMTDGKTVYGRVLRTRQHVKPIYISCGNYIDLDTTTKITLQLVNQESRLPLPVRFADLATRKKRKEYFRE